MNTSGPDLRVDRATLGERDPAALAWAVIAPRTTPSASTMDPTSLLSRCGRSRQASARSSRLHWCVAEVSNGGFDQFFLNPTGLLAHDAADGFHRIGVPEAADLVTRARVIFADRPAPANVDDPTFDEHDDAEAFDAYQERHQPLEERLLELVDGALYPKAAAYVRAHPEEFVR